MAIGAIIGIAASIFQAVQAVKRNDAAPSKADQLFSRLDAEGKGALDGADLQTAFDKIATEATLKSEQLFAKLDSDGNGQVTKEEFSSSINRLTQELDDHYARLRMKVDTGSDAGFTREQLSGAAASLATGFEQADKDGNGRVTVREAIGFAKSNTTAANAGATGGTAAATGSADGQNVELMLQVMRLMQAYGAPANAAETTTAKATRISTSA